jgi:hypothetical protein
MSGACMDMHAYMHVFHCECEAGRNGPSGESAGVWGMHVWICMHTYMYAIVSVRQDRGESAGVWGMHLWI